MKTRITTLTIVLTTLTSSVFIARGQEDSDQAEFPKITRQPVDDAVPVGSRHIFTVQATNGNTFQWFRNGVPLEDETNSTLTLENVKVSDVGLYQCSVAKGAESVPTRTATLNAFTMNGGGGPITVFGTPSSGGGGQGTSCPGPYAGYVNYIKPSPQWGYAPTVGTTIHTATDTNRSDTHVVYLGRQFDSNCGQTTVTVPDPTVSTKYRFSVYFPNNVPTNSYPLVLEGFDP